METIDQIHLRLKQEGANTQEILDIFDELDPVNLEFMMSRWRGSEDKNQSPPQWIVRVNQMVRERVCLQ